MGFQGFAKEQSVNGFTGPEVEVENSTSWMNDINPNYPGIKAGEVFNYAVNTFSNVTRTLHKARMKASLIIVNSGDFEAASTELYNGLVDAAAQSKWKYGRAIPNTIAAVGAGLDVAKSVYSASAPLGASPLRGQVRFETLDSYYQAVYQAHDLDMYYYRLVVSSLDFGFGCRRNPFPVEYFNGMQNVAKYIINTQQNLQRGLVTNEIEINATRSLAKAALTILSNSTYFRSFGVAVFKLEELVEYINVIEGSGFQIDSFQIAQIRGMLASAARELNRATYHR
jgi:hypothetical protein